MIYRNRYLKSGQTCILFCAVLFAAFAVLAYLFPYSGDDWAWGSEIGLERLESGFDGYNGRYLGNLLVLALTRRKFLQTLTVAASTLCLCVMPAVYCSSLKISLLSFSALLIFLIPKQVFVQSVVWTAGFSNYIPPILLVFAYFLIIRNTFGEKPVYKKYIPIMTFLLGFACTLFMENVTLYAVVISFLIALYTRIKHGKLFLSHIANLVGCVLGAAIMFSNSAYSGVLAQKDRYRSTAMSEGFMPTLKGHLETIINQLFVNNIPLIIIISVLCVILAVSFLKKNENAKHRSVVYTTAFLNVLTAGLICAKNRFPYWIIAVGNEKSSNMTVLFFAFIVCIYCLSVLLSVIVCVTDNDKKFSILLLLISAPVLIAPLLIVNPIGPRCFMPPYFMMSAFCVGLFDYLQREIRLSEIMNKGIMLSSWAVSLAIFIFAFSVYSTVHTYAVKRDEYVIKQVEKGESVVIVCKLPYGSYVWTGDPVSDPWDYRYKLFNGINENIKFEFLSYSEFDKWAGEYSGTNP